MRMKRAKIFSLIGLISIFSAVGGMSGLSAGPLEDKFAEANRLYEEKDFEGALVIYEQLARDYRIKNADLYYNLGNTYMKLNRLGYAIHAYYRAKKSGGLDSDLKENLRFAESLRLDKIEKPAEGIYTGIFRFLTNRVSINQGTILVLLLYALLGIFIFFRIIARPLLPPLFSRYLMGGMILLIALSVLVTAVNVYKTQVIREGVLLSPAFEVRSGPGEDHTALFSIHEGLKMRIRGERGAWYQISLDNGLSGWVEKSAAGVI